MIEFNESDIYELPEVSGVYMLMNDDELVYIGETNNLKRRCLAHNHVRNPNITIGGKLLLPNEFNKVLFLIVENRKELESKLIDEFRPKENFA